MENPSPIRTEEEIGFIASLHRNILPWSVVSRLGPAFMIHYYSQALSLKNFSCLVYRHNGKPVGFISYSQNSDGLLFSIIKRNPLRFLSLLAASIISNPKSIITIFYASTFVLFTQHNILPNIKAEIIAFAVSPNHRHKGIGKSLLLSAKKNLRKMNTGYLKVQTEKNNAASNAFYKKMGFTKEKKTFSISNSALNAYWIKL